MRKTKIKYNRLKAPSVKSRVWKVVLYFTVPAIIYNYIFFKFYGMDKAMLALDMVSMLVFAPSVLLTIFIFYNAIKFQFKFINLLRFIKVMKNHDNEVVSMGYSRILEGVQGIGKTFNLVNDTVFQAADNDRSMRISYYLQYPFKNELQGDRDFEVLEQSYNYFEDNKINIPHLMSNFNIWYQGKINYPFSMEYIDQQKRLAEGFVLGVTEFANEFPNTLRTVKEGKEDISNANIKNETFSLSRQMFDLTIIGDEQRTGETFLGYRSVVSSNRYLVGREKVLRPKLIEWYVRRLERKVLRKGLKTSRRLSKRYNFWAELCEDIGFYRFWYIDKEAIKDRNKGKEELSFIVSCDFKIGYDSRGKRFDYPLYDFAPDYRMPDKEYKALRAKLTAELEPDKPKVELASFE